jgi:hypothetical protein
MRSFVLLLAILFSSRAYAQSQLILGFDPRPNPIWARQAVADDHPILEIRAGSGGWYTYFLYSERTGALEKVTLRPLAHPKKVRLTLLRFLPKLHVVRPRGCKANWEDATRKSIIVTRP